MESPVERRAVICRIIARLLDIDPSRVVPEANFFSDLGGTEAHLKPLRLAIEDSLRVAIDPIVEQVNARTVVAGDGKLAPVSLMRISAYLGPAAGIPHQPVPFPSLFTVAMILAMTEKAIKVDSERVKAEHDRVASLPQRLIPDMATLLYRHLGAILDIPVEKLAPTASLPTAFGASLETMRYALARMEHSACVKTLDTWDQVVSLLQKLDAGDESARSQLTALLPHVQPAPGKNSAELLTPLLLEQVIVHGFFVVNPKLQHLERQSRAANTVEGWTAEQQEWFRTLPAHQDERSLKRLMAGGCRYLYSLDRFLESNQPQILTWLDALENYVENGKGKSTLEKAVKSLQNERNGWAGKTFWTTSRHLLDGDDALPALRIIAQAIASEFRLTDAEAHARFRSLHDDVTPPTAGPSAFPETWRTTLAVELARQMYESRDFTDLPRLAHRLKQAGCDDARVLNHCGDPHAVHVRGCWVIEAVLQGDTKPPKSAKAKSSRAAEPRLLSHMGAVERKYFNGVVNEPSRLLKEDWHARFTKVWDARTWLQSQGNTEGLIAGHWGRMRRLYPDWPSDRIDFLVSLQQIQFGNGLERRIWFDDPVELIRGISCEARMAWVWEHIHGPQELSVALLPSAMAVRDYLLVQRMLPGVVVRSAMQWDEKYLHHLAVVAIAQRDTDRLNALVPRIAKETDSGTAMDQLLIGIAERDGARVVSAIQQVIDTERAAKQRLSWGITCVEAHQMYRLAEWMSHDLVAGFDVAQAFPWDAAFFDAVSASRDPLLGVDLNDVSPWLHSALVKLELPGWLVPSNVRPEWEPEWHRIACDVVLTELGPNSTAVTKYLRECTGLSASNLKRQLRLLPVTIRSRIDPAQADRIQRELAELGARVEIHH